MDLDSALGTVAETPNSVLLVTSRPAHESQKSYLFTNPEYTYTLETLLVFPQLLEQLDSAVARGLYAAGYIGYECGYAIEPRLWAIAPPETSSTPLAWFGFYRHRRAFDYAPVIGSDFPLPDPQLQVTQDEYVSMFNKVKLHIWAGNTYQVNLTTKLKWTNRTDPASLFAHLMAVQPVEFGAFINLDGNHILSASPELFFRRKGSRIITRPMKGTASRGLSIDEQKINAQWLAGDEKNRSENVMIVDLLRNDLRRVCSVNTVKVDELFAVEAYPTILQMTSTVSGRLGPDVRYSDIFNALFPCGSITGAPKVRTMEIIRDIEKEPRGVYTGSIGFIAPDDEAVFNVAIRTLVLRADGGEMGIGGGIVWDSDAHGEFEECRLKANFLSRSRKTFQLIETILWKNVYTFLDEHLSRLEASAKYFQFPCNRIEIEQRLADATKSFRTGDHRVRLLLD